MKAGRSSKDLVKGKKPTQEQLTSCELPMTRKQAKKVDEESERKISYFFMQLIQLNIQKIYQMPFLWWQQKLKLRCSGWLSFQLIQQKCLSFCYLERHYKIKDNDNSYCGVKGGVKLAKGWYPKRLIKYGTNSTT